ncbi:uncharacterized protein MYCFIDRAFT_77588 [Pseudocercospora fijiensis CIRAD86]|uniref:MYND-type zinc finger protein samB n=1 Tax=Pseudocercospora fijiensis (strain CIRAD86) TaxID=383855 RepID=M3AC30_PSEFD|nr:uncharacterized protein MYCFIDRAFT_77588 [Pseudocercospora fijiensis CIRAD86]EME82121.1 hypothetical protein MYCFIDRAFT_77588 [Pseudocercospora fijiensis CIRAD86]
METCASCADVVPRPILTCFECSARNAEAISPAYCSTRCRSDHRDIHLRHCNQKDVLRGMYRAGDLLQSAFYLWRRVAFDMNVKSIEKVNDILVLHDDITRVADGQTIFFKFPASMVPDAVDQKKLLSFLACTDGIGYMYELARRLLSDYALVVEELGLEDPRLENKLKRYYTTGGCFPNDVSHAVLAVEHRNGESYIIDLSCAQFGYYEPVTPFNQYFHGRAGIIKDVNAHGCIMVLHKQAAFGAGLLAMQHFGTGGDLRINKAYRELYKIFNSTVDSWEGEHEIPVADILRCEGESFARYQQSLLSRIESEMKRWISEWEDKGCPMPILKNSEKKLTLEEQEMLPPYAPVKKASKDHYSKAIRDIFVAE